MSHFSNLSIEEQNKIREAHFAWRAKEALKLKHKTQTEEDNIMFGGKENKPTQSNEKYAGLEPGTYVMILSDVRSGVAEESGIHYWVNKLTTEDGKEISHFITCEPTSFKTEEKVYNAIARQMESLLIYDYIGKHETLESFVIKAIDTTYKLVGKKVEFTIKKWKMDGKEGKWGEFTGFLDTPVEGIQSIETTAAFGNPGVDENEEINF